jgi:hypothetical protein
MLLLLALTTVWCLLCMQVAEQGTHAELLEQRGIYWGLVRRQQKGLGPADRDLSPRKKDPPMLTSKDWDYGEAGGPLQSRCVVLWCWFSDEVHWLMQGSGDCTCKPYCRAGA